MSDQICIGLTVRRGRDPFVRGDFKILEDRVIHGTLYMRHYDAYSSFRFQTFA